MKFTPSLFTGKRTAANGPAPGSSSPGAGHVQEFQRQILPHLDGAYNLARYLTRDAVLSEDVVQDALVRAFRAFDQFRGGSPREWLFAILHNGFVSTRRQMARRPQAELPADDERPAQPAQEHALMLDEVAAALETLPDEQRAVLLLVGVEDLTYEEAARVLDVPVGTIMSRLSRGRERLRRAVENGRGGSVALRRVK